MVNSAEGMLSHEPYLIKINSKFLVKIVNGPKSDRSFSGSYILGWFAGYETLNRRATRRTASKVHVPDLSQLHIGKGLANTLVNDSIE
jgi:hypothetical protein